MSRKLWVYDGSGCDERFDAATPADLTAALRALPDEERAGVLAEVSDPTAAVNLLREQELMAMASAFAIYHRDLCSSLQLDPARATPEDVIGLVAALTARIQIMAEKRGRCAAVARERGQAVVRLWKGTESEADSRYFQDREESELDAMGDDE